MANNRIYLYCTKCNRYQYIAKCFGDHWSTSPHEHEATCDMLVDFMDNHFFCSESGESRSIQLRWEHGGPKQKLPDSSMQEKEQ